MGLRKPMNPRAKAEAPPGERVTSSTFAVHDRTHHGAPEPKTRGIRQHGTSYRRRSPAREALGDRAYLHLRHREDPRCRDAQGHRDLRGHPSPRSSPTSRSSCCVTTSRPTTRPRAIFAVRLRPTSVARSRSVTTRAAATVAACLSVASARGPMPVLVRAGRRRSRARRRPADPPGRVRSQER
jgi:hypothetical protein